MNFQFNPSHDILLGWTSCIGTSLVFSRVHPTAFAMHAFKDFPRTTLVLALDYSLVHDTCWGYDSFIP